MKTKLLSSAASAALSLAIGAAPATFALVGTSHAASVRPMVVGNGLASEQPIVNVQAELDLRPAAELTDAELQTRIKTLKALVEAGAEVNFDARAMLKADRQERKQRRAAAETEAAPAEETAEEAAPSEETAPEAEETAEEDSAPEAEETAEEESAPEAEETAEEETAPSEAETVESEQPAEEETAETEQPATEEAVESEAQAEVEPEAEAEAEAAAEAEPSQEGEMTKKERRKAKREERRKQREQAEAENAEASGDDAGELTEAEQQQAVEEAKAPATVSKEAEKPKEVAEEPVEQQVKKAETEQAAVVSDDLSKAERRALKKAEKKRRERARERRSELLGAAAAGAVIGALVPALGGRVAADEGDRLVIERDGELYVRKDESTLLRGRNVKVEYEQLQGGRVREIITRRNGSKIITVRDPGGYVLRRIKVRPNGKRIVLYNSRDDDGARRVERVDLPPIRIDIPRERYIVSARQADRELFRETFAAEPVYEPPQRYSLQQVRENENVRSLVRRVDLDTITFDTGSATVTRSQVALLGDIAGGILDVLDEDPSAVFLVEGHTDAVGSDLYNLTLSDRRAETVARILVEAYDVPPENLVIQGYGEEYLKVETEQAERANRRVTLRNISPILEASAE